MKYSLGILKWQFILPYFDYRDIAQSTRLQKLQNRAARVITK